MSQFSPPPRSWAFLGPLVFAAATTAPVAAFLNSRQEIPRQPVAARALPASPRHTTTTQDSTVTIVPLSKEGSDAQLLVIGSLGDAARQYAVAFDSEEPIDDPTRYRTPDFEPVTQHRQDSHSEPGFDVRLTSGKPPSSLSDSLNARRIFFLQTGNDPSQETSYQGISSTLLSDSGRVSVWWEDHSAAVPDPSLARELTQRIEEILPRIHQLLGNVTDLDGDGRLAICITPRLAAFPRRETPVYGLVQINDFQIHLPRPFSNHADVMFLSPDIPRGPAGQAILAHEGGIGDIQPDVWKATHRVRRFDGDWLGRGVAHAAEIAGSEDGSICETAGTPFSHIPPILHWKWRTPIVSKLWNNDGSRGAAWSFVTWLASELGPDGLRRIVAVSADRPKNWSSCHTNHFPNYSDAGRVSVAQGQRGWRSPRLRGRRRQGANTTTSREWKCYAAQPGWSADFRSRMNAAEL
ncbi:MAG: hypothetical protein U0872_05885 [Planctomycetaceae bacterium]